MTEVSVATWNLHQAIDRRPDNVAATWRYLEDEIRPTVALIQEAGTFGGPPRSISSRPGKLPFETTVLGYGVAVQPIPDVITRYSPRHSFAIQPSVPGAFAAAHVTGIADVEPFVAISVYGVMAPLYAQTSVLRTIADLIPLFDSPQHRRRIVLGGDLNVYDQTTDKVMRTRWQAILGTLESLGLVNLLKFTQVDRGPHPLCPCRDPACWHVETFRHRRRGDGGPGYFTTDYLFASEELAARLIRPLEVWGDRPEVWALSDHCPLVARFDL